MKNSVLIYTRVSSDEQVNNMSLSEQERQCRNFVTHNKDFTDLRVEKIFVEEGESAKTANRTKLKELLEYCRENKEIVGHVVVYKLDRLARNVQDHVAISALLRKMGIILWSATEPINSSTTGKLMENVLASFAQFDNDVRSERCRSGMQARALEGGWVVPAPVGYTNSKDELRRPTLEYSSTEMVKAINKFFKEYSTGRYRQEHAPEVAKKCGIRLRNGNTMSRNAAIALLSNVAYKGMIKSKLTDNIEIKGLHPAIVSPELFDGVQDILAGRKRSYAPPSRFKLPFPLKRFLVCGQCGHNLTASAPTGGSGVSHPAYHCPKCTIRRNGARVSIPVEQAHSQFAATLDNLVPSEWTIKLFKEIVIRHWNSDFREVQAQRQKIDLELKNIELNKNKLFDRWMEADSKVTDETYASQNDRLTIRKTELEFERSNLKTDELDKEKIVDEAVRFIANAGSIWLTAKADNKILFQKLVFETGITVNPDKTFGTNNLGLIYQQLTELQKTFETTKAELPSKNSALVHLAGFEPTTFGSASRRSIHLSYRCKR
jgi:site-specific DNA recombinase